MNATPMNKAQARQLHPLVLAYIGDAVYELYVRSWLVGREKSVKRLHAMCIQLVSAVGQEKVWHALQEHFNDDEAAVARRGRNAKGTVPQNVEPATYRRSTSLEAVFGYLFLSGQEDRIFSLLETAFRSLE